jgi:hypothetical protein
MIGPEAVYDSPLMHVRTSRGCTVRVMYDTALYHDSANIRAAPSPQVGSTQTRTFVRVRDTGFGGGTRTRTRTCQCRNVRSRVHGHSYGQTGLSVVVSAI